MATSSNFYYTFILLLICRAWSAPLSPINKPDILCSTSQLVAPGQGPLVYQYKTEVKLSVANGQFDLKTEITANVHIKSLGDCNYAIQLRNVKVSETKDEDTTSVTSTGSAQRELENLVVRFRWVNGFVVSVEADASAKVDHVNFVKGVLSSLQVYSPVPDNGEYTVREEDVLGVCTTQYKYSQRDGAVRINKNKDLSTCSKDKLHLSSSPVLTSLFGPLIEEVFMSKTHYICQTEISNKNIQSVKCKTIEAEGDDSSKSSKNTAEEANNDRVGHGDDSSEEDTKTDFDDDEEISTKLVSIKQQLTLQTSGFVPINENSVRNPVRQTLQFVPTASFDRSNEAVSDLVSKIKSLLKSEEWNQFAAAQFVDIANELRRMDKTNIEAFKARSDLKHLTSSFLNKVYAHDPSASLLNLDVNTLKFSNPLSVFYLDKPSTDLVQQVVQAAYRLTESQVPDFVGVAAKILKTYKTRQDNNKDADDKIKEFQKATLRFLFGSSIADAEVISAVLSAYAQLGLYDDQVKRLASDDEASLEVQYNALNAIRHISDDYIDDSDELRIRRDLQDLLLRKIQNKALKNAVRVWAFDALYTPFIYNPEEDVPTLGDELEAALSNILNEPLDQVNGYIWSALKYSSLDRICPLRGLASRLRVHNDNKKQFLQQPTLSSRQIQIELPLRKNYEVVLHLAVVFENDRVVPSFISFKLAMDGIRRETLRLPWIDIALISENLDWNFADYFLRLDPLNKNRNNDEEKKAAIKNNLPSGLKQLQDSYDSKEEDPDPTVHLYLKLFGAEIRSSDITDKVQDLLRSNIRSFIRSRILSRLEDLVGKDPIFRIPLEIGAASSAANGLTLYRAAQFGILADLTTKLEDNRDESGSGSFSMTSRSALSFSLTLQREISSPLTTIGETAEIGILSNVPFEYKTTANEQGRTREFNLLNQNSKLLIMDFQYATRTSEGFQVMKSQKSANLDPSCTPSVFYRSMGVRACLDLNPFRSIQLGSRPSYPMTITLSKDPTIEKWRVGWRFNARDAPQYELAIEKVGASESYPGLGVSATVTGNNFDIKFLTGMKSFTVKGTQSGNRFNGIVYSRDNKAVMTTTGTLMVNNDGFKLDSKVADIASKKEVFTLTTDISPNRGQGLTADVGLVTPDPSKYFKIHFRGDLYKADSKLFHVNGNFSLGDMTYKGKLHFERDSDHARIELARSLKLSKSSSQSGYEFFYERQSNKDATEKSCKITSHLALRSPMRDEPMKVLNLNSDFMRSADASTAKLQSTLDVLLITRNPPVPEKIEVDYIRQSVRTTTTTKRLLSPEANLKLQVKTKSGVFNVLLDHRHRKSLEPSKKGPMMLPPTFNIANKIHVIADTDKLFPDIPRPFAFDVLSDLDFELLNQINYKFQYDLRRRQRSGSFTYRGQVDKVVQGHLFLGSSQSELQWDNKQKTATATGTFEICTGARTLKSHWDINTNLVPDRNDMELDLNLRFDRQPTKMSPKSFIGVYNVSLKAPKHQSIQLIDLDGSFIKQSGKLETFNSIAYRKEKVLKEINVNAFIRRNQTGDGSLQTHVALSFPFKYLPYITHDLQVERSSSNGRISQIESKLLAKPVFSHHGKLNIDRSIDSQRPYVRLNNQIEYLRGNGDMLFAMSKLDVQRWSALHSFGILKRNTDLLHKHSVGYTFSKKTRKVALSLHTPEISGNPLSIIAELTIDKENRIGKMKWPQQFGVHLEFGTPITNLTAFRVSYNLPMFNKDHDKSVDATLGFKLASSNIAPIIFYLRGDGSLRTTLRVTKSLTIGDDIALSTLLTAQYNPQYISQISSSISAKYYEKEFQNNLHAVFKKHQVIVRGILNRTDSQDYKYEMDIGFDSNLLTGHTERTDGQDVTTSDIEAQPCAATGNYYRCYKGDVTVQAGSSGSKGTFDINWGRDTAKLNIQVPNYMELNFDHTHAGRIRDDDFYSRTSVDGRLLQSGKRGSFSYLGSVEKEDGKWNNVQFQTSLNDMKTGQKAFGSDIRLNQKITDKRLGQFQRKINVNFERQGQSIMAWSSEAVSCSNNPSYVVYGICQTGTFNIKASNLLAQRLRQRLQLPADPRLSNPAGQVSYDGTLNLDLKSDPKSGPHTVKFDLNRLSEDAIDVDLTLQPRVDDRPMSVNLRATLPRQNPISLKYDETRRTPTNFNGVLRYSFNANDNSAEKTFQCDVDRPQVDDVSINCRGERTTITLDIDRNAGVSKVYMDLNRFTGERVGYELVRNPQTKELDATLYTFVNAWNIKRQPGKSTIITVKQNNQEVFRAEGTKTSEREINIRFSPSNVYLKFEYDPAGSAVLTQTFPQQRSLVKVVLDRAQIRRYLPSLRNQDRPSYDIDEPLSTSQKPLFEISFDSNIFISLSQATAKLGSHNGLYGLETVKKAFKLQIGDAPLTVYNTQHWKTHFENTQLPESFSIRIVNDANGNFIQFATNKWNEHRAIVGLSHSFDGGQTLTTDLELNRNYGLQVGSIYFFHSLGSRNVQGIKQLRNFTRHFIRSHLRQDLEKTNMAEILKGLRGRIRSILEKDYAAVKDIVASWGREPDNSFLRRFSARLGLPGFFAKYPTYAEASDKLFAILRERSVERKEFWRSRFDAILDENRLQDLSKRWQARRAVLVKALLERAEKVLDRFLPKADQQNIDERIANYVRKLLAGFEQGSKRNSELWKAIFRAIDNASKGEDNKWFRTLIADIDSNAFAAAVDAEQAKVIKKLSDSSKLFISNLQHLSRRITKRREAIRERVKNAIRHLPKIFLNDTDFEVLLPIGPRPRSYSGRSELLLGIGSLLRNRDQALDTIRCVLQNRLQSRTERFRNYYKAIRAVAKRLFKRNPSLAPEFTAIIANTGDAIDLHGDYVYLNQGCDYVLAHDFGGLQFSFRFSDGKIYSLIPNPVEVKEYECSNTGRVQVCNQGYYSTISVPMYYGGLVDGALGDVRDRSGKGQETLSRWSLRGCSAPSKESVPSIFECASENDGEQEFCENFVQRGLRGGLEKRLLIGQARAVRKYI